VKIFLGDQQRLCPAQAEDSKGYPDRNPHEVHPPSRREQSVDNQGGGNEHRTDNLKVFDFALDDDDQALARMSVKGAEVARVAIEMANLLKTLDEQR